MINSLKICSILKIGYIRTTSGCSILLHYFKTKLPNNDNLFYQVKSKKLKQYLIRSLRTKNTIIMKNQILLSVFAVLISTSVFGQNIESLKINNVQNRFGIEGATAPELDVALWVDGEGNERDEVKLSDYEGKFKVIYCFQAWCPGCHSRGLPSLQKMTKALEGNDKVEFFAIQTVFEGKNANTYKRMKEVQEKYDLHIPFGHDVGDNSTRNISSTMNNYRTGGTPWFILIDQNNKVVFNDYHLDTDKAIEYLKTIE